MNDTLKMVYHSTIKKEIIQGIKENSMVDDIMDEIFGEEWRTWE